MTVGIDDGKFILIDQLPGEAQNVQMPSASALVAYTATALFQLGTKIKIYDATNNGLATLVYGQFNAGSAAVATVKSPCGVLATGFDAGEWYKFTNDASDAMLQGPIVIALGTTVDEYYGWFWCGGVCPVDTISGLDGIFPSDGSVDAATGMKLVSAGAGTVCQFEIHTASSVGLVSAFAMAADTTA